MQVGGCAQGWGCGTGAVEPHFLHTLPKLSLWKKRFGRLYRLLCCVCQEGMASGGERMGSQTCSMVLLSISAEWGPLSAQCIHPPNPTLQLCPGLGGGDREDSRGSGELCCSWGRLGAVTKVTELSTWLRSPR